MVDRRKMITAEKLELLDGKKQMSRTAAKIPKTNQHQDMEQQEDRSLSIRSRPGAKLEAF